MNKVFVILVLIFVSLKNFEALKQEKRLKDVPFWNEIDSWSSCSVSCGEGVQQKLRLCFKKGIYLIQNVPNSECSQNIEMKPKLKKCNMGECGQIYFWKATNWSSCSQSCGYNGIQSRDVECYHKTKNGEFNAGDQENCNFKNRPENMRKCSTFNCPPSFSSGKWGKCQMLSKCMPGKQRRELKCNSLQSNGSVKELPRAACYSSRPPPSWRKCFDHINPDICSNSKKPDPEILLEKKTLVQMRRVRRLNLKIGNVAYIISGTRVSVVCPVKNYVKSNLQWYHKDKVYTYKGKSKKHIKVSRSGRLIIKSFTNIDQGEWFCKARTVRDGQYISGRMIMKLKSLSEGFQDWAIRVAMWNRKMPNEDPRAFSIKQKLIRWVTGPWSQCSLSCNGVGTQNRLVRCENLENRFYYQLKDEKCMSIFNNKPPSKRKCVRNYACPTWSAKNINRDKCTNNCMGYEVGQVSVDLSCQFQDKSVDFGKCDPNTRPYLECKNPNCTVKWKISKWSQCSRSCGSAGIQARYLICVWNASLAPAGNFCYKKKLEMPKVVRKCQPPPCNLRCVDLSPNCPRFKRYCRYSLHQYRCCKTCKAYYKTMKTG